MIRTILFGAGLIPLAACATTTSFAPPPVKVTYTGHDDSWPDCGKHRDQPTSISVSRNVAGALQLADGFIHAYRCSAHAAANGRQVFEIPAFLATTGAATAVALGGGSTYGIVGTTANAAFTAGNSYWGPKQKAAMYDHALDALLCIRNEAVGADPQKTQDVADKDRARLLQLRTERRGRGAVEDNDPEIAIPADRQYFALVSTAAYSVERILAQRLSNMAAPDADAAAAKLVAAIEAILKAQQEKAKTEQKPVNSFVPLSGEQQNDAKERELVTIKLKELKGELDKCVVRASL